MTGRTAVIASTAVASLALVGCGADDESGSDTTATKPEATTEATTEASTPPMTTEAAKPKPKPEPKPKPKPAPKPRGADRFEGVHRTQYELGKDICSAFAVSKVARDIGARSSNPVEVAEAYAKDSAREPFRAAAFEGCLDGFRERGALP